MEIRLIQPALELKEKATAFKQEYFDHEEFIINGRFHNDGCFTGYIFCG